MSKRLLLVLFLTFVSLTSFAGVNDAPIVIVSSYNPDVKSVSDNLALFSKEYSARGCSNPVMLENMNCLNLAESFLWKRRLWGLLSKYYEDGRQPAAIILLGNEASSTFFSLEQECVRNTPVLVGLRGDNLIQIPSPTEPLHVWKPSCKYVTDDFKDYNIIGGYVYQYNISKNIELIEDLAPDVKTIAFISDNSFGGVTMYSHFANSVKAFPEYDVIYLDGRTMTLQEVNTAISKLDPANTALLIGTWRIDKTENYALSNTTYALAQSNPKVRAFSLSSVGLGHWVIGGYSPEYCLQGTQLADDIADYLQSGEAKAVTVIPSSYSFDQSKLIDFGLSVKGYKDYKLVNEKAGFIKENLPLVLATLLVFVILMSLLAFAIMQLHKGMSLQKKLEARGEELKEERDKAEKASAMKSNFIANISHEIRTPLNAIVGFSQLLSDPAIEFGEEEKSQYGSYIKTNSDLLLELIDDVLDLSKMDLDRLSFKIQKLDLVALAKTAVASARANCTKEVDIVCESSVPSLMIDADKERLLQVFSNLLSNAKKCTESGTISVYINYKEGDKMTKVSVSDTGVGIPPEKAEEVFERFKKLDEYRQGTGLGLPITRSIVEHFGGRIWVDTTYTSGARFEFTLPLVQEQN